MEVHMQESTGNDRNTALKQRLEVLLFKNVLFNFLLQSSLKYHLIQNKNNFGKFEK